jgi:large conductance mechanosensitive channel
MESGKIKHIIDEFKKFAIRGNAMDMAIGIIIGAAFSQIVNSLVKDVIMPPIGWLVGGVDFSDLAITLKQGATEEESVRLQYGIFLNTLINFVIVAIAMFSVVKLMNKLAKKKPEPPPSTKKCPECQMDVPKKAIRCGHCTTTFEIEMTPRNKQNPT